MAKKRKDSPARARGRRRHRRGVARFNERIKAAAHLRPFSINCHSKGHHREYDRALFAAAGRPSDGSGFGGGQRDHYWVMRTSKEAREMAERLMGMPGLTHLVMNENILDTLEIMEMARFQKRVAGGRRHRGKRMRLVRGR